MVGTDDGDRIAAKSGDDTLYELGGEDRIDGGPGDDLIVGDGMCRPVAMTPDGCRDGDDRPAAATGSSVAMGMTSARWAR